MFHLRGRSRGYLPVAFRMCTVDRSTDRIRSTCSTTGDCRTECLSTVFTAIDYNKKRDDNTSVISDFGLDILADKATDVFRSALLSTPRYNPYNGFNSEIQSYSDNIVKCSALRRASKDESGSTIAQNGADKQSHTCRPQSLCTNDAHSLILMWLQSPSRAELPLPIVNGSTKRQTVPSLLRPFATRPHSDTSGHRQDRSFVCV